MGETVQVPLIVTSDVLHNGTLYGPGREAGDRLVAGEEEAIGLQACGVATVDADAAQPALKTATAGGSDAQPPAAKKAPAKKAGKKG